MSHSLRPALLLTCTHCGQLHVPIRPLVLDLHPLCPLCAHRPATRNQPGLPDLHD